MFIRAKNLAHDYSAREFNEGIVVLFGDTGKKASAYRLRVARESTGMSQQKLADAAGRTKGALQAMERGTVYPSREVMQVLYEGHNIDYNWMIYGEHRYLTVEVWDKLQEAAKGVKLPDLDEEATEEDEPAV